MPSLFCIFGRKAESQVEERERNTRQELFEWLEMVVIAVVSRDRPG